MNLDRDDNLLVMAGLSIYPDVFYSRKEAAVKLGVSMITIDRHAGKKLPKHHAGRRVLFKGSDLLAWLRGESDRKGLKARTVVQQAL